MADSRHDGERARSGLAGSATARVLLSATLALLVLCLGDAATTLARPLAAPGSAASAQTYFVTAPGEMIGPGSRWVVRPATLLMHPDGSWFLEDLRWSGWGSATASARGISNVDLCDPNCAAGPHSRAAVHVTLSNPGPFQGHRLYRCLRIKAQGPKPNSEQSCLKRFGSSWIL